jgi:hypothetical protein
MVGSSQDQVQRRRNHGNRTRRWWSAAGAHLRARFEIILADESYPAVGWDAGEGADIFDAAALARYPCDCAGDQCAACLCASGGTRPFGC